MVQGQLWSFLLQRHSNYPDHSYPLSSLATGLYPSFGAYCKGLGRAYNTGINTSSPGSPSRLEAICVIVSLTMLQMDHYHSIQNTLVDSDLFLEVS